MKEEYIKQVSKNLHISMKLFVIWMRFLIPHLKTVKQNSR